MAQVWRLHSGSIGRADGSINKAPYDFIPTDAELAANKWRMSFVCEVAESATPAAIAAKTPATTQVVTVEYKPEDDIAKVTVAAAVQYIHTIMSESELDRIAIQERNGLPKSRVLVSKAIAQRRALLQLRKDASAMAGARVLQNDIASSENKVNSDFEGIEDDK